MEVEGWERLIRKMEDGKEVGETDKKGGRREGGGRYMEDMENVNNK